MIQRDNIYKNSLIDALKGIRKSMVDLAPNVKSTYLYFEKTLLPPIGSNSYEKNYMMPFLILVSNPCSHILKCGGCTMCGYSNLASFKHKVSGDKVYQQFKRGLDIIKKIPRHEMIAVGTAGSFLDPNEIPYEVQAKIIKEIASSDDIFYMNIEARAEYITQESLRNIIQVVDDPYKLSIGVGLESSNDLIRELCVNKCMSTQLFTYAIKLLKKYNISPTVYVTIGKPFINDWTNIIDAIESIKFAFREGADRVVLLRLGIQPNSLIEWLYRHNLYKPIEIWSVIEVLKKLPDKFRKDVLIANPRLPKHLEIEECQCTQTATELLNEYKGTLDIEYIEAATMISCPHKEEWYRKLEKEADINRSVETQVLKGYNHWLEVWKNEHGKILQRKI